METSARHLKWLCASLLLVMGSNAHAADEAALSPELDVWVADAPADVVIRQLAELGGRELVVDGELSGNVSGRFKGSFRDALNAVAEQTPVLFDISDATLSATDDKNKIRSSIVAGDNPLDEATREALVANLTPGNDIEFSDNEVIVSGHPIFVRRTAMTVTAAFADSEHFRLNGIQDTGAAEAEKLVKRVGQADAFVADAAALVKVEEGSAAASLLDETQKNALTPGKLQSENSSAIENAKAVTDVASTELVKDMSESAGAGEQVVSVSSQVLDDASQRVITDVSVNADAAQQATVQDEQEDVAIAPTSDVVPSSARDVQRPAAAASSESSKPIKEFQWVTDIPGFDTF